MKRSADGEFYFSFAVAYSGNMLPFVAEIMMNSCVQVLRVYTVYGTGEFVSNFVKEG